MAGRSNKAKILNIAPDERSALYGNWKPYVIAFLIVVTTLFAFSPLLHADFVNLDDPDYVKNNETIRQLNTQQVTNFFSNPRGDMYIPLAYLSYAIEYSVFKTEPTIYHVDNILLHVINSLLVLWLVWLLTGRLYVSAIVAGLFALHPFHVESVAWISERKDLLYAMFFLGAIICYYFYASRGKMRFYWFAFFLFILSCLSKPMAVTFPVVLLCYDIFYSDKRSWKIIVNKIPFFIVSAVVSLVAIEMMNLSFHNVLDLKYNVFDRIVLVLYSVFFYVQKTLLPINFSATYIYPEKSETLLPFYYILCALLLLLIATAIFLYRKKGKVVSACFLFFIITLLPVLQFLPNTYTVAADRYSYIPTLGIVGIVVFLADRMRIHLKITKRNSLKIVLFALVILTLSSYQRSKVWMNGITLYTDIIEKGQYTEKQLWILGDLYDTEGLPFKALSVFRHADSLYPNSFDVKSRYAYCLEETGKYDSAISEYRDCLALNPYDAGIYVNLGDIYLKAGRTQEALAILQKGYALFPDNNNCLYNLAYAHYIMNDKEKAKVYFGIAADRGFAPAIDFLKKNSINLK